MLALERNSSVSAPCLVEYLLGAGSHAASRFQLQIWESKFGSLLGPLPSIDMVLISRDWHATEAVNQCPRTSLIPQGWHHIEGTVWKGMAWYRDKTIWIANPGTEAATLTSREVEGALEETIEHQRLHKDQAKPWIVFIAVSGSISNLARLPTFLPYLLAQTNSASSMETGHFRVKSLRKKGNLYTTSSSMTSDIWVFHSDSRYSSV